MRTKIYPTSELRDHMSDILKSVCKESEAAYITVHGKPQAVIMSTGHYEKIMSDLEDYLDEHDEELWKRIDESRKEFKEGKSISLDEYLKRGKKT